MASRDGGSPKDQGFPNEFGVDMYQDPAAPVSDANAAYGGPPSFWGYVTPGWFGPFLLSPRRRNDRGRC